VWRVPITRQHPQGVRYRLAFIPANEARPVVLYDNHHPKGHHRHIAERQAPYGFIDVAHLIADFLADVRKYLRQES
jgi:hypothetical protein